MKNTRRANARFARSWLLELIEQRILPNSHLYYFVSQLVNPSASFLHFSPRNRIRRAASSAIEAFRGHCLFVSPRDSVRRASSRTIPLCVPFLPSTRKRAHSRAIFPHRAVKAGISCRARRSTRRLKVIQLLLAAGALSLGQRGQRVGHRSVHRN